MKRKLCIVILSISILLIAGLGYAGNYFYNLAINANTSKSFLNDSEHLGPSDTSGNSNDNKAKREAAQAWAETIYVPTTIQSNDNLTLNGYWYDNPDGNHRYALVVHGYMGKALDMVVYSKRFYDAGYSVLAPDCRGCGSSEGDYTGMGWVDRLDMLVWIDQIIQHDPLAEIALYGISMGGATVMMTSGEELPSNVKVIVEDCGYTSAEEIFVYQLKDLFNLPKFPIIQSASIVTKIRAGYFLGDASALEQVKKSITPTLFIHGDVDKFVPYSMLDTLYNAATCEKEQLIVPGAAHGYASTVAGQAYWDTVFTFVAQYIPA